MVAREKRTARGEADRLAAALPPLLSGALRVAQTVAQGVHGRRRVGMGETFWQFRRYGAEDPVSSIDWRQTAKSQETFVREYEWEAEQSVWIWCDASGSMDYASGRGFPTKRFRAATLALALSALLLRAGERVAVLGGAAPPGLGRQSIEHLAAQLASAGTEATDSLPPNRPLPARSDLVLLSDFLAPIQETHDRLAAYAARGVSGYIVQVLDPAEHTLPFEGRVRFEGLEGEGHTLIPRVDTVRAAYVDRIERLRDDLTTLGRLFGWHFLSHHTDRPPETALLALYGAMAAPHGSLAVSPC